MSVPFPFAELEKAVRTIRQAEVANWDDGLHHFRGRTDPEVVRWRTFRYARRQGRLDRLYALLREALPAGIAAGYSGEEVEARPRRLAGAVERATFWDGNFDWAGADAVPARLMKTRDGAPLDESTMHDAAARAHLDEPFDKVQGRLEALQPIAAVSMVLNAPEQGPPADRQGRPAGHAPPQPRPDGPFNIALDRTEWTARRGGASADFAGKEYPWKIFQMLCRDCPGVTPKDRLLGNVWGKGEADESTLFAHMTTVRSIIKPLGLTVENRKKVGYRLTVSPSRGGWLMTCDCPRCRLAYLRLRRLRRLGLRVRERVANVLPIRPGGCRETPCHRRHMAVPSARGCGCLGTASPDPAVDVSEADWRNRNACRGGADRRARPVTAPLTAPTRKTLIKRTMRAVVSSRAGGSARSRLPVRVGARSRQAA
jgi:hypothetical protein